VLHFTLGTAGECRNPLVEILFAQKSPPNTKREKKKRKMNIFNVLSQGKSRLHEPSISAMLGYLLDTQHDHGLRDSFFRGFLNLINEKIQNAELNEILNSGFIKTSVTLEEAYNFENSRKDIDIEISILDKENNEIFRIIIENKIKASSGNKYQLSDYYLAITEDEETLNNLILVFLTPDSLNTTLNKEFENLVVKNGHEKVWIKWNGSDNNILELVREIIDKESKGMINPINEYMRHTLKAFIVHLNNTLESKTRERIEFGEDIGEIVDDVSIKMKNGEEYRIIRRNSTQIQIFFNDEKIVAKPILRKIIQENNFDIPLNGINTRTMGKKVIDALRV